MDPRNAGPQFQSHVNKPKAPSYAIQNEARYDHAEEQPSKTHYAEFQMMHYAPSGGVNHSPVFTNRKDAHHWAASNAAEGSGSHADTDQKSLLTGYSLMRRTVGPGTKTPFTQVAGGHYDVQPMRPGDKGPRAVIGNHMSGSFNGEEFRQKSSAQWRDRMEQRRKKS